jgi:hypothetical protein
VCTGAGVTAYAGDIELLLASQRPQAMGTVCEGVFLIIMTRKAGFIVHRLVIR